MGKRDFGSHGGRALIAWAACMVLCAGCGPGGRAVWSFVIPGVGQFMNDEAGKGALMLGLNVLTNASYMNAEPEDASVYILLSLGISTWSAVDAYTVAEQKGLTDLDRDAPSLARVRCSERATPPVVFTTVLDPLTGRITNGVTLTF